MRNLSFAMIVGKASRFVQKKAQLILTQVNLIQNSRLMKPTQEVNKAVFENWGSSDPILSKSLPKFVPTPFDNKECWDHVIKVDVNSFDSWNESFLSFLQGVSGQKHADFEHLEYVLKNYYGMDKFFKKVLPWMIQTLKDTPKVFRRDYPFLVQGKSGEITLSKEEVKTIMVNSFFSTFWFLKSEYYAMGEFALNLINFTMLNSPVGYGQCVPKIRMILNYFERMSQQTKKKKDNNNVGLKIERICIEKDMSVFSSCEKKLCDVQVKSDSFIEDMKDSCRHTVFADKFVGGSAVSGTGGAQEEIRFCINPDCVVSMLFCPCMLANEAVVIHSTEQFSKYKGFGGSLEFGGNYEDEYVGKYDITCMDALNFRGEMSEIEQFKKVMIDRELWKSYVAFFQPSTDEELSEEEEEEEEVEQSEISKIICQKKRFVSTGGWGTGAYLGDKELKFLIQWLSCSVSPNRTGGMIYCTFGPMKDFERMKFMAFAKFVGEEKGLSVSKVYKCCVELWEYCMRKKKNLMNISVMDTIREMLK